MNVSIIFLRVRAGFGRGGNRSRRHTASLRTTSCPSVIKQTRNQPKSQKKRRGLGLRIGFRRSREIGCGLVETSRGSLDGQAAVVAERSRREHLEQRRQSCMLQPAEAVHRSLASCVCSPLSLSVFLSIPVASSTLFLLLFLLYSQPQAIHPATPHTHTHLVLLRVSSC